MPGVFDSEITINILSDDPTPAISGYKGLFANDNQSAQYDFYATDNRTRITLKNGVIHKAFLTGEASDNATVLQKKDGVTQARITSIGSGTSMDYPDSSSSAKITGYQNWDISDNNLEPKTIQ